MSMNDHTKHVISVIKQRNKIKAHFESFKDKVGDQWKTLRAAYGDEKTLTATSPEVVIVNAWPDRVKTLTMIDFADWLSNQAVNLLSDIELSDNGKRIDVNLGAEVNRCSQSVNILMYEADSGLRVEQIFTFDELAGMLALGYDFHSNNITFFIK